MKEQRLRRQHTAKTGVRGGAGCQEWGRGRCGEERGKTLQPQHALEAGPGHTLPPVSSLRTGNRLGPAVTCLQSHSECSSLIVFLSLPLPEFISLTLSARSD